MRKILVSLLLLLSCQTFSQVQAFHLKNGLKILVKEDHRAPVVVSMVWYNVGSSDEPGGLTGVSHAIEHMMFKGTPKFPLGVFSKTIATLGGQENAFTHHDYTAYFEKTDATHLATCFELEADRMTHLQLDANEFAKEIKVIQEERRMRTDDNPQALAFERFLATAHLTSPYHHPVIGWMSDLEQMTVNDLKSWYHQHYSPNNATLVVVGAIRAQEVQKLAERYFASIPMQPVTKRKPQKEPPMLGKKIVHVNAPAKLPMLLIGYAVPSITTSEKKDDPYALELIAALLDAGEGSRFAKHLIRGRQVANKTDVYYNLYSRYPTQFIVLGSPSKNHPIKELQNALTAELEQLKTVLINDHELQKVKNQLIAQKTFETDSIFGQAMALGLLETIGTGWKTGERYVEAINQVTPVQIQEVTKRYFKDQNMTIAYLNPMT